MASKLKAGALADGLSCHNTGNLHLDCTSGDPVRQVYKWFTKPLPERTAFIPRNESFSAYHQKLNEKRNDLEDHLANGARNA